MKKQKKAKKPKKEIDIKKIMGGALKDVNRFFLGRKRGRL